MRIHHLDCGPARPFGGALMDGVSPGLIGRLSCHCLAIETARHGVVLVDTGLGLRDVARPYPPAALAECRAAALSASMPSAAWSGTCTGLASARAMCGTSS